ncbi:MAG: S-layer homology domain-containing protein [Clostridiales Family XIII bacterium]|nr:S-layer homology domain-containing protein [Clostridiales Family XIII bacterium]
MPFKDVRPADWFFEDLLWAHTNRFVSGSPEFSPGDSMTRAMLVAILWRMAGEPSAASVSPFADVGSGDWFRPAAVWAATGGVVSGGGGYFEPNEPVTRQEFAAMLLNYAAYENKAVLGDAPPALDFADADSIATYAAPGVAWCYEKGIVRGRPGRIFDPLTRVSRAEMVALLHRYAALS